MGPQREPLAEARVRGARPGVPQADPGREPLRRLVADGRQTADVQGQLDRRAREVEVRALQDPQLDEGLRFRGHGPDVTQTGD